MNYYLYRLKFDTAVHFGASDSALSLYTSEDHFCSDTLFSALCHTALTLKGEAALRELCRQAEQGELLLSDGMPWSGDRLYLPKPCVSSEAAKELHSRERKAVKKLRWIPVDAFPAFADSVHGGKPFDAGCAADVFGAAGEAAKARIKSGDDALPYQVGLYYFAADAGLWFIAGCASEEQSRTLDVLVAGLGLSGIGGKVTAGYGKFHIESKLDLNEPTDARTKWLGDALSRSDAGRYLLLSTALPGDEELTELLPDSEYTLIRRGGFISSGTYADEERKKTVGYFLGAGSVLPGRFGSRLYEAGESGRHPVYRFSGPVMLGVSL